jgi:hypothetical protein
VTDLRSDPTQRKDSDSCAVGIPFFSFRSRPMEDSLFSEALAALESEAEVRELG